ncbi:hypothetical protein AB4254_11015 [Vibrio breoganii]
MTSHNFRNINGCFVLPEPTDMALFEQLQTYCKENNLYFETETFDDTVTLNIGIRLPEDAKLGEQIESQLKENHVHYETESFEKTNPEPEVNDKLTTHEVFVSYKGFASVKHVFFSKDGINNYLNEIKDNPDFNASEPQAHKQPSSYYVVELSQFINCHCNSGVKAGDVIQSKVTNTQRRAYTTPELLEIAQRDINQHNKGMRYSSDRYYDQPWV